MDDIREANPLTIKRRVDDGKRLISLRISEELLQKLDRLAVETNRSRNERMILILEYGVENIRVEERTADAPAEDAAGPASRRLPAAGREAPQGWTEPSAGLPKGRGGRRPSLEAPPPAGRSSGPPAKRPLPEQGACHFFAELVRYFA